MAGLNPRGAIGTRRAAGEEQSTGRERSASSAHGGRADAARTLAVLVRTIEGEVIPRLTVAHRADAAPGAAVPDPAEVAEMAKLAFAHELPVALSFIEALRARGRPLETIFLELLAPAARHLGDTWKEDLCDSTDVTPGACVCTRC